jgi:FlaG/FlaF family flagellin (archaellin)
VTTPHPPSSPDPAPRTDAPRTGERTGPQHAFAAGAITFVAVLALIVGGTLGVRALVGGGSPGPTAGPTPPASSTASESATASGSAEPEWCWDVDSDSAARTSTNPEGRLRGGGLEFVAPSGFDELRSNSWAPFTNDAQTATATVEDDWVSSLTVAQVVWQDGVEYPGAETASGRILDCMVSNVSLWDGTSQRTLEDRVTTPVTIDGMSGYRTSGNLMFGTSDLTKTTGSALTVIVVDTPEGPSMFSAEIAIGVDDHEKAEKDAERSLSGLTG